MTRRAATGWLRDIPNVWKVLATIAAAVMVGWLAGVRLTAAGEVIPRLVAVEGRVGTLEQFRREDRATLESILCYVRATAGEGTVERCALR